MKIGKRVCREFWQCCILFRPLKKLPSAVLRTFLHTNTVVKAYTTLAVLYGIGTQIL